MRLAALCFLPLSLHAHASAEQAGSEHNAQGMLLAPDHEPRSLSAATGTPRHSPSSPGTGDRLLAVEVVVNGSRAGQFNLLQRAGGFYATPNTLQEWRLRPSGEPISHRGLQWFPLFAIPGYKSQFDHHAQTLDLEFSAAEFPATRLAKPDRPRPVASAPVPAVFVNYDVSQATTWTEEQGRQSDLGALLELGVSAGPGVLSSGFVGRNLAQGSADAHWRRLETTWTTDIPAFNLTVRLGDTVTPPGMWGRSVIYGGIQIGTNFALSSGFITQPLPTITGTAQTASTVELYVNDALRQVSRVPSGQFTLENLPLDAQVGEARVVVRDLLGRETVLVRPFFTHGQLLRPGLSDWSVDAGRLRRNLGLESADYGESFVSGVYRRGLNELSTAEARLQLARQVRSAGAGVVARLPFNLLLQAAGSLSQADNGLQGGRGLLRLEQLGRWSGVSLRAAHAAVDYRELGMSPLERPYRLELSSGFRYSLSDRSNVAFSAARLDGYDRPPLTTASTSFSTRVGANALVSLVATRVQGSSRGSVDTVGIALLLPLQGNRMASANVQSRSEGVEASLGVSQPVGFDAGVGWRVLGGRQSGDPFAEAGMYYQGWNGLLTADLSHRFGAQTLRLGAQGALAAIDGRLFASRPLRDSFALVEVPGHAGVGIGMHGSKLTRTDRSGAALLPRLAAYQSNHIHLDPNDLPFTAEIDNIEETAVPRWRSAVKVQFPVRSGRAALLRIVLDDGEPAPAGAEVTLAQDPGGKTFHVARRGEAYVTGLESRNTLRLQWKGQACSFAVELATAESEAIPRLGPFNCKGVPR